MSCHLRGAELIQHREHKYLFCLHGDTAKVEEGAELAQCCRIEPFWVSLAMSRLKCRVFKLTEFPLPPAAGSGQTGFQLKSATPTRSMLRVFFPRSSFASVATSCAQAAKTLFP